jgi:hypothetical protein
MSETNASKADDDSVLDLFLGNSIRDKQLACVFNLVIYLYCLQYKLENSWPCTKWSSHGISSREVSVVCASAECETALSFDTIKC